MPAYAQPPDDFPASATPTIIRESVTHIVLAADISKALMIGHLSFKPVLGGLEISLT